MAFLVEDGNGLATANSYASVDEFKVYHKDRGNDHSAFEGADIRKALIKATDYIDRRFKGFFIGIRLRVPTAQRLEWPRTNAFYPDGTSILGLPTELKEATMEYAFLALSSTLAPNPT